MWFVLPHILHLVRIKVTVILYLSLHSYLYFLSLDRFEVRITFCFSLEPTTSTTISFCFCCISKSVSFPYKKKVKYECLGYNSTKQIRIPYLFMHHYTAFCQSHPQPWISVVSPHRYNQTIKCLTRSSRMQEGYTQIVHNFMVFRTA